MTFELHHSRWRWYLLLCWVAYMMWVAFFWLGFMGVSLVCIASTGLLRHQMSRLINPVQRVLLDEADLCGFWQLGAWLCVHTRQSSLWIMRTELQPGQWAVLSAYLIQHSSRQAVGLRISS